MLRVLQTVSESLYFNEAKRVASEFMFFPSWMKLTNQAF